MAVITGETRYIRRAALVIAENENDPQSGKWLDGSLEDAEFACYSEIFRTNDPPLQAIKRKLSVWVARQAGQADNKVTQSEINAVKEAVTGRATLEFTERALGPWWGSFSDIGLPRTRDLDPDIAYIPTTLRVAT